MDQAQGQTSEYRAGEGAGAIDPGSVPLLPRVGDRLVITDGVGVPVVANVVGLAPNGDLVVERPCPRTTCAQCWRTIPPGKEGRRCGTCRGKGGAA